MACPICFTYNRPDRQYFMTADEIDRLLEGLLDRAGPVDLVNITGGEPTLHPEILSLLARCRRDGIGRVTMNSNGLRLASDEDFCRALADAGVCVTLSLHTLRPERSVIIHGRDVVAAKRKALENLERFGVPATLLNCMIRGVNDDEIGEIVGLAADHSTVRSVTVQTMTFTGQHGGDFGPREHMPLDGAAAAFESATAGRIRADHFFPHPGAHPLCYSVGYFLRVGDGLRSFTDFFTVDQLRDMLTGGYLFQPADRFAGDFKAALDNLWAEGDNDELLAAMKELIGRLYPSSGSPSRFDRQRIAEQAVLTVYLHSHMDEDTLDLARLVACPDQVPDSEGRLIPACAYNLFYRQADPRFWVEPKGETPC